MSPRPTTVQFGARAARTIASPIFGVAMFFWGAVQSQPRHEDQPVQSITSEISCPGCRITSQIVLGLGKPRGPVGEFVASVARDTKGRTYLIDDSRAPVKVFGADGHYLQSLGQSGAGAGGSVWPASVTVDADGAIFVIDRALYRCNVFGPDLRFRRAFELGFTFVRPSAAIIGSQLVLNAESDDPLARGYALLAFSTGDGHRIRAVGQRIATATEQLGALADRRIGRVENGPSALLIADYHRPEWIRVSADLGVVARYRREGADFRAFDPTAKYDPKKLDGTSEVKAIWEDKDGYTWLVVGITHVSNASDRANAGRSETTLIEVIDTRRRTVMAREKFAFRVLGALGDNVVVADVGNDRGASSLALAQFVLRHS